MNKNQFKIFREAIKQTFSIKKIFEELSTLHIQEYFLLFLMTIAQVISFLFGRLQELTEHCELLKNLSW